LFWLRNIDYIKSDSVPTWHVHLTNVAKWFCQFQALKLIVSSWNFKLKLIIVCRNFFYGFRSHQYTHTYQYNVKLTLIDFTQLIVADQAETRYVSHTWDETHCAWISAHLHKHKHQYSDISKSQVFTVWFCSTLHSFLWPIQLKLGMWVTHESAHIVREFQLTHTHTHINTATCVCDFDRLYTVFCGRSSWKLVCESSMGRHTSCENLSSLTHTHAQIQLNVYVILIDFTQFFVVDRAESWYVSHAWDNTNRACISAHSHIYVLQHIYKSAFEWFHSFWWIFITTENSKSISRLSN